MKKFQIVLGKKVIVDVVFFSSNFFYIRFGLMLKIDHNMHWRIQVGNEPNPGGFVLIMFSHWVVLYQILVRAEWVRVRWVSTGCLICNKDKVMWSSISFVYL